MSDSPTLVTDDNELSFNTCAICTLPARVFDGPIVQFTRPSRVVCAPCVSAITSAT